MLVSLFYLCSLDFHMSSLEELILHLGESGHAEEHFLCGHGTLYSLIKDFGKSQNKCKWFNIWSNLLL